MMTLPIPVFYGEMPPCTEGIMCDVFLPAIFLFFFCLLFGFLHVVFFESIGAGKMELLIKIIGFIFFAVSAVTGLVACLVILFTFVRYLFNAF